MLGRTQPYTLANGATITLRPMGIATETAQVADLMALISGFARLILRPGEALSIDPLLMRRVIAASLQSPADLDIIEMADVHGLLHTIVEFNRLQELMGEVVGLYRTLGELAGPETTTPSTPS